MLFAGHHVRLATYGVASFFSLNQVGNAAARELLLSIVVLVTS